MVTILLSKKQETPAKSRWFTEVKGDDTQNAAGATYDEAIKNLVRKLPGDNLEYTVKMKTCIVESCTETSNVTPPRIKPSRKNRFGFGSS